MKKSSLKNVIVNDTKTWYVVRLANGKTKEYKTLTGAERCATKNQVELDIPTIVTANTYFWTPNGSASGRRSSEKRRQNEIDSFCEIVNRIPTIYAEGSYNESCHNVYKSMSYHARGKSTNITGLIGECARWGLILIK